MLSIIVETCRCVRVSNGPLRGKNHVPQILLPCTEHGGVNRQEHGVRRTCHIRRDPGEALRTIANTLRTDDCFMVNGLEITRIVEEE